MTFEIVAAFRNSSTGFFRLLSPPERLTLIIAKISRLLIDKNAIQF